jgi:hypothetical protein
MKERRMRSTGNDRGAVRLITISRLVVVLGIVGVLGYDGFSIASNHVNTENDAQTAAYAASSAWHAKPNVQLAYQAAVQALAGTPRETVLQQGFTVDADGTVHLLVRDTAPSLVLSHIGPLRHYTVVTEHGDANSVN